ncbi:MAG: ribonuclease HI [Candidatus ainarchaeum sp.]|nr:ribonuclease HI [Candidatus ainarchaeum sp.]
MINAYTDGACSTKSKIGGWGVYIEDEITSYTLGGYKFETTNNEMELTAVVEFIKWYKNNLINEPVVIYSDSAYVVNCFIDKWYEKWLNNGWIASNKKPVKHKELWQVIIDFLKLPQVSLKKVAGHSNSAGNERADEIAVDQRIRGQMVLKIGE